MKSPRRIAIDAMGGDGGVDTTVPAAIRILRSRADLELVLVGDRERIKPLLAPLLKAEREKLQVLHTDLAIGDEERPESALRTARESSMFIAAELVKSGDCQAMVSAGNSGALLMAGRHLLKTIPGIHKPAMAATIPGAVRQRLLLDVGANPECEAQHLFEFAVMGSVLAESLNGSPPRLGLLNIGAELYKGTGAVREAGEKLAQCPAVEYVGFIEANEVYQGGADVVVCDGFVGNVTVKASQGVANMIRNALDHEAGSGMLGRVSRFFSASIVNALTTRLNPERFNGACLLGLQGNIVKSHGNASALGFSHAILAAASQVDHQVPRLIGDKVEAIMSAA